MDYKTLLSDKIQIVKPSGIRKFFDIVAEMKDAISLGVGEPDFVTPLHIREAGISSLKKGETHYTSNWGLKELRKAISKYLSRKFYIDYDYNDQILVTVGGSEAIDLCIRALINPGDEVLIPEPSFVCYTPLTILAGGTPVHIKTYAKDKFKLTPEALKAAITPKTKLLILPYPCNPTGGIMTKEDLEKIAEVLRGTNILVLSDEIYGELTYSGKHVSIASLPGMYERTIVASGFSKAYAMTGWRLGYLAGPSEIIKATTKLHQYAIMSSPTTSQYAAIDALENGDDDVVMMRNEYDKRRRLIVDGFNDMGLSCFEPEGAFYVFPSIEKTGLKSEEFCEKLLCDKKVAVVPGNAFGDCGEGFIRASYCYSTENLKKALDLINNFVNK